MGERFYRPGVSKLWWVPSITDPTQPTAAEVNGGIDMSTQVADIDGLSLNDSPSPAFAEWGQTVLVPELGMSEAPAATLHLYDLKSGNILWFVLARGSTGNLVMFWAGTAGATPAFNDLCEVWPVVSSGPRREYSLRVEAARYRCLVVPTSPPEIDAIVG